MKSVFKPEHIFFIVFLLFCHLSFAREIEELVLAIKSGDPGQVEKALQKHPDINQQDEEGNTPLHHAAKIGSLEAVKKLVTRGAELNYVNNWGMPPISLAAIFKHRLVVEYLEGLRAINLDIVDKTGLTPRNYIDELETV